ncbi:hypothetical protein COT83_01915 [Candidatus Peregrinibacteria bacterium CG10_big_fil_rev_8_21_14_0_10_44_7]|nr:MAG: hypothetical protein AUK45_03930 [Candidatus Peregrinibacteria bacterium CG2_30_44_17]PIS04222.1 MAG: hypothetical protein COT83_01915 [Candidatus Peregrinibacteria bacterium CG10_big_fil_rev_8_21_14_0_10_44_7]PIX79800.1 MAG: hypothetical protein COZ35_02945 [Candidatus Peregrinibacteria bacterium CG_4_10_14_3_um_filter_44_21]PJB88526.1 MAG: hypothetical protein CO082_04100 [Candidatus Peregrinibacteria bacterium CG_4_9_14_0_8_um_filter_44_15]
MSFSQATGLHDQWQGTVGRTFDVGTPDNGKEKPMQRHYLEGKGDFDFDDQQYSFHVSYLDLPEPNQSMPVPASRVITEVAPDLNSPHDIVVPVLMGWGETSAQMEGSMLKCLLRSLKKNGYANPQVIGVNCVGKGTPAYLYADNQSEIGLDDARALAKYLHKTVTLEATCAL